MSPWEVHPLPAPELEDLNYFLWKSRLPTGSSLGLTGISDRAQRQCSWTVLGWPPHRKEISFLSVPGRKKKKSLGLAWATYRSLNPSYGQGDATCCRQLFFNSQDPFLLSLWYQLPNFLWRPTLSSFPLSEATNLYTPSLGPRDEHLG